MCLEMYFDITLNGLTLAHQFFGHIVIFVSLFHP